MYRKSLKDTKENLEGINSIPEAVRQMFSVALLYESDPNDSNFRAMHQRVLLMNASVTAHNRTLPHRPPCVLATTAGRAHRSHQRGSASQASCPASAPAANTVPDGRWRGLVQRLSLTAESPHPTTSDPGPERDSLQHASLVWRAAP